MPIKILMPALSPTMEHGNLAKWVMQEGDKVIAGDVMAEIETDKATMEIEAVDEGILGKIIVPQGTEGVAVNSLIAVLLEEGEDQNLIDGFIKKHNTDNSVGIDKESPTEATEKNNESIENITQPDSINLTSETKILKNNQSQNFGRIFASPLAKRIAQEQNIDLSSITGSGPHGRIIKSDVLNAKTNKRGAITRNTEEYHLVKNSSVRKVIAKRLVESKQTVPHFYLSTECIMDDLLSIRSQINQEYSHDKTKKLSVNDFVISAAAKALSDIPEVNASWSDEAIIRYNNIDISVAVAIDDGLITPIIKNANQKDITTISLEMKDLAKRAKTNSLKLEEFQGGGFSISNLGMYGIKNFNAIINPPQSCILSVGASSKRGIVINDKLEIRTIMDVSISCDHRVVDGAIGARFLNVFKKYIESPILMFI